MSHPLLNGSLFFVKEYVGFFKAANEFDVFDPNDGTLLLQCREPNLNFFTKLLRFSDYKRMTPFEIIISSPTGEKIVTVKRGISIFLSTVEVFDEDDIIIGKFKQKFFSIGGAFDLFGVENNLLATLKGKWTGWDFKFLSPDGQEFASVNKKWAGIGKELFTTADNYVLQISDKIPPEHPLRGLIIAAVMCIDMVLKE
ncbi:MAG: RNAase [Verrucomicrobia bacterium]|nr:RNAase [Cytophagales bacterium]